MRCMAVLCCRRSPDGAQPIYLGLGCFWGAERLFWQLDGVWTTAVGYMGGLTENPTYEEVCSGQTGHTEAVLVVYQPAVIKLEQILSVFWQAHDPRKATGRGMISAHNTGLLFMHLMRPAWSSPARPVKAYGQALSQAGYGSSEITSA